MTVLVDKGDAAHFLDDEPTPGLKDRLMNATPLVNVPEKIFTAGSRKILWSMTCAIYGSIIADQGGKTHRAHFPST